MLNPKDGTLLCHRDPADRLRMRSEAISSSVEGLRAFADVLAKVTGERAVCVFGSRQILAQAKAGLEVIDLIG